MSALAVTHTTPADGTFSAAGQAAWDAQHTLAGTEIGGYDIPTMGLKLAGLPSTALSDVAQNGTVSTTGRGTVNFVGSPVVDNSGNNSKDIYPFYFSSNQADFTLTNTTNAQTWLEAARDTFTVEASTTYFWDAFIDIQAMGATTRTTSFLFGGTATFTSIRYESTVYGGVALAVQTAQSTKMNDAATAMVLVGTNNAAATVILLRGIMRIDGGGTLIPQIQWSADPTGTPVCKANSYIRFTPAGTSTRFSAGTWA